jgi:hypothetical protein
MAREPTLKQMARRVRDALRSYAEHENWPQSSYRIFFRPRGGGFLHFILVSDRLHGDPAFDDWNKVHEFLQRELQAEPVILERLRLALRSNEQVDEGGLYEIAPDYAEMT